MLHPCMQTDFLKNMENSSTLHGNFRLKVHDTYKFLQELAGNKQDSYKFFEISMQNFEELYYSSIKMLFNTSPEQSSNTFLSQIGIHESKLP